MNYFANVRFAKHAADRRNDFKNFSIRDKSIRQTLRKAFAPQQLHYHIKLAIGGLPKIKKPHRMRMLEIRNGSGFVQKSLTNTFVARKAILQEFERNFAVKIQSARAVDRAHSAFTELVKNTKPAVKKRANQRIFAIFTRQ